MDKSHGWARVTLAVTGLAVAAGLSALPWLCLKAGLLVHVGKPAFGLLVAADATVVGAILWRAITGRA
ncbi:MAG: hypothetical protein WCR07_14210 [Verrucomicrobiota bacterium]|jgi:hypothetical protein